MHFEMSPLIVLIALWIVNTSEFHVCICSNKRDITQKKCRFLHNNDAKAIAIPRVFSENRKARNGRKHCKKKRKYKLKTFFLSFPYHVFKQFVPINYKNTIYSFV